ncbi:threonine--tRNA ligase [Actinoplanes sp. NPDC051859]|uniref:threonine--tRNA ligase n=1 Tax=Actinoplanes sp. NPDC051859 TaxID=3363909 RepID=UPI003797D067
MLADHRRLGRDLDIFDSDPLLGAGLPFWLPAGAAARYEVESYVRDLEKRAGYQHVYSPVLGKRELYERSGHWAHFADDMFPAMPVGGGDDALVLRPSLCPHHALIFKSRPRSYRDLPLRIAELGSMYRAERSGVLGGLTRVRAISLNDGHVFCAPSQAGAEVAEALRLMGQAHAALGLRVSSYRVSLRGAQADGPSAGGDKAGGGYAGGDSAWDAAGRVLREALEDAGLPYEVAAGEAAFYGPKIDVQIADPVGRESTLSTVQLDFHQPAQFGLSFADAAGGRDRPVMVHRSLVGSFERLFAHLLEAFDGALPPWYSPVQVVVLPVAAEQDAAAAAFARDAIAAGLRAEVSHDGSLGARIRAAAGRKVPYLAVVGAREAARGEVALRLRDGRQLAVQPGASAVARMRAAVAARAIEV